MSYAESTTVDTARSVAEMERTIRRFGATQFMSGWDDETGSAVVGFKARGFICRFRIPIPNPDSDEFWQTETGRARQASVARKAHEQAVRQRFRSLALVVKAKLVAVDDGVATFEREFLPYIVLPDESTIGDRVIASLPAVLASGELPPLLPAPPASQ